MQKDIIVFSDHNITTERQKVESKSATSGKLLDFGTVEQQKSVNNNLYVYVFHHSNAMDMKGNINYFGGKLTKEKFFFQIFHCKYIEFRRAAQLRLAISVWSKFVQTNQQEKAVTNRRQTVQKVQTAFRRFYQNWVCNLAKFNEIYLVLGIQIMNSFELFLLETLHLTDFLIHGILITLTRSTSKFSEPKSTVCFTIEF